MDVDYTLQPRHQVAFVRPCTRLVSALLGLVWGVNIAFIHRRRPGGHARVVLTQRAQPAMFSGRTCRSQAGCRGSQVHASRHSHHACAETGAVPQVSHMMFSRTYLYIPGSVTFNDYRTEFVSWDTYHREIATYGEQAGILIEPAPVIAQLRTQLETAARQADAGLPTNTHLRLEHDRPVLKRLQARPQGENVRRFTRLLKERMLSVGILEALVDTEHWLNWTQHFGPLLGHQ